MPVILHRRVNTTVAERFPPKYRAIAWERTDSKTAAYIRERELFRGYEAGIW